MKFQKALFWLFIFFFTIGSLLAQAQFKSGAAAVNITPSLGTVINGDFLPYYAKTIHDSLYSKALAFESGNKRFVFVVVDCMAIDGALINDTKKIITAQTGLKPNQIMISATHAHSCGAVRGGAICPADLSYRLAMPNRIAKSVKQALANLEPSKIAWGKFDISKYVSCRRWFMKPGFSMISPFGDTDKVWMNPPVGSPFLDRPVSPPDPQVSYLAVKSVKNKWISIMANYSIHYAADIPEHTISADYFGEFHKQLQAKLKAGENFVGIMSNGTSGDVNTTDFRQERNYPTEPYGKSKLIANDISDSIIHSLVNIKFDSNPRLNYLYEELSIATRKPSDELVAKSKKMVANLDYKTLTSIDKASNTIKNAYAIDLVELSEYQQPQISLPIQAVKIGEGVIGTLPGEIFSETGLKLKKQSASKFYFTICLANAEIGYIPPVAEFKLGGYETWLTSSSQLDMGAEEKVRLKLVDLIKLVRL